MKLKTVLFAKNPLKRLWSTVELQSLGIPSEVKFRNTRHITVETNVFASKNIFSYYIYL